MSRRRGRPRKKITPSNTPASGQTIPDVGKSKDNDQSNGEKNEEISSPNLGENEDVDLISPDAVDAEAPVQKKPEPHSYAEVVKGSVDMETNLQFIPAIEVNGTLVAQFTVEDVIESTDYWRSTVVCCVLGANPPLMSLKSLSGLSKLGSLIGPPIKRDRATAKKSKYAYARIHVEVRVHQNFPNEVIFIDETGRAISQKIEYEWYPCICSHCKRMGHLQDSCRGKEPKKKDVKPRRMMWKPKAKVIPDQENEEENKGDEKVEENPIVQTPEEGGMVNTEPTLDEGFTEVSGKKATRKIILDKDIGDFMSNFMKILEKAPCEGHFPFLK
ncbi:hypothetical protein DM860_000160 [Cuscuta australis]|uniref:DUF4283 domain-containing protein n=1 Tax=Cuscuta australis TaxID=267555 RepID=A0A328CWL9_9ASTE|nr:hypothetical protein DM860_000160 [Cuscuta australis]